MGACHKGLARKASRVVRKSLELEDIASVTDPNSCEVTIASGFAKGVIVRFPLTAFESDDLED